MIYTIDLFFLCGYLLIRDLSLWLMDFQFDIYCRNRILYLWFEYSWVVSCVIYIPHHTETEAPVAFFICLATKAAHDIIKARYLSIERNFDLITLNKYNMKQLIDKLGAFFGALFNSAKRTYNKLPKPVQTALLWASGFVNTINENIDKIPKDILGALETKYPEIKTWDDTLLQIAAQLNLANANDGLSPEQLVELIQKYLAGLQGKFWAAASRDLALIAAIIFAPPETKVEALASLLGYVYHDFIKKD